MQVTIHSNYRLVFPTKFIVSEGLTKFRYVKLFYRKKFLYITFGSGSHLLYANFHSRVTHVYSFLNEHGIKLDSTFKAEIIKTNKYKYKICLIT